ncbi:tetratricopeptide repeat protein [Roseateles sp. P5_E7]
MLFTLRRVACATALLLGLHAHAQEGPSTPFTNSAMDGQLFLQLLQGELLLNEEEELGFQLLLDAARRTGDEPLFERVVRIALSARDGRLALMAARAWAETVPDSMKGHLTVVQVLALLNKPAEVPLPLVALLRVAPAEQRPGLIAALPRLFQRAPDSKAVWKALSPVLKTQPGALRPAALYAEAKLAINAGENARALAATRELARLMPDGDDAMQLAVELMSVEPQAEALITERLAQKPDQHALRQAYGRALIKAQRPADAAREFGLLTEATPDNPANWLALGAIELELKHLPAAETALRESLKRLDTPAAGTDAEIKARADGRQSAWLMLSRVAEQKGDLKAAEAALLKVDGSGIDVKFRRASLLARQGKLAEGRKLLKPAADASDADARAAMLAEAQLLREQRDFAGAAAALKVVSERFPDDTDLIYEQAMMSEKLGRFDEMEALLRKVIELKADHHHAYNALGYSFADRNVRLPEAKQLIESALKMAPGESFIVDSLGWVEFRLGNLPEAARLLRQAYAGQPDAEIAAHLGEVLWASGAQDEARKVLAEAAQRDADNEALRETMGRLKVKP